MCELVVNLSGICVNVFGFVPSVPMRTVLPNAMSVQYGTVLMPGDGGDYFEAAYYLMPHRGMARTALVGGRRHDLFGSYITVLNAKPQPFRRDPGGYSLSEFTSDVQPSPEVVLRNRALAYFDCFGGTVQTVGEGDEPRTANIYIKTNGTPRVSIAPLPGAEPEEPCVYETNELYISNLDIEPAAEDAEFDFLLNYLVTVGGIPRVLTRRVPGLSPQPRGFTLDRLGVRMRSLGLFLATDSGTVAGWQKMNDFVLQGRPNPAAAIVPASSGSAMARAMGKQVIDPLPFSPSCSYSDLP